MAHKFDTKVQFIKYKVLREVARLSWNDTLLDNIFEIPKIIVPGPEPFVRCCIYKERAIVQERIKIAQGGNKDNPNIIEVINIACDECPVGGYTVTDACRGCLAHHCEDACRRQAITYDEELRAHIDKSKCVECGLCAKACPYDAIVNRKRPCEKACKVKAISMLETGEASINNDKCISCGACVFQCPFGAIMDKSFITDVIDLIKKSENNTKYKVYALVAPSIASQFTYTKLEKIVTAIKKVGFHSVVEVALGADMVAEKETLELVEKGFLTSSCCPAFVSYIYKNFPNLVKHISHNMSPMGALAKFIKEKDPSAKVVFIGPCTAKKAEAKLDHLKDYVDNVLTFEEIQALIDSKDIDVDYLEETPLNDASLFGRIFARIGGLTDAVKQAAKELNVTDFEIKPIVCDGIDACRLALLKANRGALDVNFIEGMACIGGCVNGAGNLTHLEKNRMVVEKHSQEGISSIKESLNKIK